MNYEEKYNEALERAKKLHDSYNLMHISVDEIEQIFPELAESEDERIRKRIYGLIYHNDALLDKEELLAWLEKQKEQKPAEWGEEDENCIRNLESVIYYDKNLPTDTRIKLGDFLKSLKPQSHWKPSEHQMTTLKNVKEYVGKGSGYWGEGLGSLIDDLEKLI